MKYTVTGRLNGTSYTVQWEDGKVRATDFIKQVIRATAKAYDGLLVGPPGQYTIRAHLKNPLSALFIMREVFDEIETTTGDTPDAAQVPEGAIG